ncbi:MAG: HugZ family protein [Bosea sp. (in: a-proteobacteria)]
MAIDPIRTTDPEARLLARALLRGALAGSLATLDGAGRPFCSLVSVATDVDGTPIILVSRLSGHTKHLLADTRASLLLARTGKGDPLAHPRITLDVETEAVARDSTLDARLRERFLNRHPKAALYADFPDFLFFALHIRSASLNGGFGRAYQLGPADLLADAAVSVALSEIESSAISHMNEDHQDAIAAIVGAHEMAKPNRWRLTGLDPNGLDFCFGSETLRVPFEPPLAGPNELRSRLALLAKESRARLSGLVQDKAPKTRDS